MAETRPPRAAGTIDPINKDAINICVGHRPLHNEKLFVIIAINLSRGLSITLVAIIPAALQPYPIAIVRACFPWAPAFLNKLSRLNATRGKYPKSSKRVKSGKNIIIGGNMTLITQAMAR